MRTRRAAQILARKAPSQPPAPSERERARVACAPCARCARGLDAVASSVYSSEYNVLTGNCFGALFCLLPLAVGGRTDGRAGGRASWDSKHLDVWTLGLRFELWGLRCSGRLCETRVDARRRYRRRGRAWCTVQLATCARI
ncbi:hypothetical protein L226DRAFT_36949 [Lentinus tigrinus ALCF2SS1-7]|uniref:Uncharacterized protein n=1 Tax=Lentinus tigrinus ALCF2SS1-6 TaxID=1328759 RepID=A0A5C2SN71_9APHY|nr:hypothetical protein L227DRAFT_266602 [Lentinus tigrinus ALCF2SS1-6]RPD82772.1 hypothetical protein L226DRAFT_36949 [Lentinus tigrinus ALCF2SS1-7]